MGTMATRRTILGAALDLFVTRGFHDTSTARIAKNARVATGTLFHHFGNKGVLIDTLHRLIAGHRRTLLAADLDPTDPIPDQLRTLLNNDLHWAREHDDQDRFLRQCRQAPGLALAARPDDPDETPVAVDLMARGRDAGELRDLPPELLARMFFGMSRAVISHVAEQPELVDDQVFLDRAFAAIWDGLRRPAAD